jgi:hypothetical protein
MELPAPRRCAPKFAAPAPAEVIQPGGSLRDDEMIQVGNDAGLATVLTAMRHFQALSLLATAFDPELTLVGAMACKKEAPPSWIKILWGFAAPPSRRNRLALSSRRRAG